VAVPVVLAEQSALAPDVAVSDTSKLSAGQGPLGLGQLTWTVPALTVGDSMRHNNAQAAHATATTVKH
jgi:hypothetical protein